MKVYAPQALEAAPAGFRSVDFRSKALADHKLTIQVAPDDCTGCGVCVDVCPAKAKTEVRHKAINMAPAEEHRQQERQSWTFFDAIPPLARDLLPHDSVKGSQVLEPLFEFSGACAGCGETPYLKLLTQLFGDRIVVAAATGCSSIYGANLPTTPWTVNREGRGPAWNNSLFEDAAEFGLGMRLGYEAEVATARMLLERLGSRIDANLAREIVEAVQESEPQIHAQRERVARLVAALRALEPRDSDVDHLLALAGSLVRKGVWIIGGDGWAYDIGFGGLDHVLASGRNVNVLVLDTEVYSNTGGQASKATSRAAVAKFASLGKSHGQERPRCDRTRLRRCLRSQDSPGSQRHAGGQGAARGRRLARTVAGDRLQHLHCPRHRHVQGDESYEGRGALRLLASVSLPAHRERDRSAVCAGLAGAVPPGAGVCL